ncbi:hypothetical protein A2U01_0096335, partial [Trifolium medium]|nr:hypothetical protein [Trifolium medium]
VPFWVQRVGTLFLDEVLSTGSVVPDSGFVGLGMLG